jgi:hypothetical protein
MRRGLKKLSMELMPRPHDKKDKGFNVEALEGDVGTAGPI